MSLTTEELAILTILADAWNKMILLDSDSTGPNDNNDFRQAISDCQRIVSMRLVRRIHPEMFNVIGEVEP